jgi:hypothetical protein
MMVGNPWLVDSIQAFSFFNCPQCSFKAKDKNSFQGHALQNHPMSFEFFCSKKPKEIVTEIEKIESLKDKTKEDKTLNQLMFPESNSKTTNYIVTEVEEIGLLKNETKYNKTLEELMFPDDCFGKANEASEEVKLKTNCTTDKVNEVGYDSETQEPTLKRKKKSKTASVLKWDDSDNKAPEGNLTCPKPNCSYETYQKRYLDQHLQGHHDCPYCDKLFSGNQAKRSLVRHLQVHGVQTEDFKCRACQKTFKAKDNLMSHQKGACAYKLLQIHYQEKSSHL